MDRPAAENAVRALLTALGLDPTASELRDTPRRFVGALEDRLIGGLGTTVETALGPRIQTDQKGAIVVTGIPFTSLCPHHLMPALGSAHLGLRPNGWAIGLGRYGALVDALSQRPVLQEDLCQTIASALVEYLECSSAVCVLQARHTCVAVTDPARRDAMFKTSASAGDSDLATGLFQEIDVTLGA